MHNDMGLPVPLSSELSVTGRALRLVLQMQDRSKLNKQFGGTSQPRVGSVPQRRPLKLQHAGESLGEKLRCRV